MAIWQGSVGFCLRMIGLLLAAFALANRAGATMGAADDVVPDAQFPDFSMAELRIRSSHITCPRAIIAHLRLKLQYFGSMESFLDQLVRFRSCALHLIVALQAAGPLEQTEGRGCNRKGRLSVPLSVLPGTRMLLMLNGLQIQHCSSIRSGSLMCGRSLIMCFVWCLTASRSCWGVLTNRLRCFGTGAFATSALVELASLAGLLWSA